MNTKIVAKSAAAAVVVAALCVVTLTHVSESTEAEPEPQARKAAPSPMAARRSDPLRTPRREDGDQPSSRHSPQASLDDLAAAIVGMKHDIMSLRNELQRQRDELDAFRKPDALYAALDDAAVAAIKDEEDYRQALEHERIVDRNDVIDAVFQSESSDPSWSSEAELSIGSVARSLNSPGVDLLSLDCRTSLCRLEVLYREQTGQIEFEAALPQELHELASGMTIESSTTDDGQLLSVIYLVRAGFDLPSFDPP